MSEAKAKGGDDSAPVALLRRVWASEGKCPGAGKSWRRVNHAMRRAAELAVEAQFLFEPGDFGVIAGRFRSAYWLGETGLERLYALSIEGPHGPNPSATRAIEAHLGRKPFLKEREPGTEPGRRPRLFVGAEFCWTEGDPGLFRDDIVARVTSFDDAAGVVVACAYERPADPQNAHETPGTWVPDMSAGRRSGSRVARVFRITHADLAEYRKGLAAWRADNAASDAARGKEVAR